MVSITCHLCGTVHQINVSQEQLDRWNNGELIQNVMPELKPDERELIISQTCGKCWDKMFPPDEE